MTGLTYLKYVPISKTNKKINLLCHTTDISLQVKGSNHHHCLFPLAAPAVADISA